MATKDKEIEDLLGDGKGKKADKPAKAAKAAPAAKEKPAKPAKPAKASDKPVKKADKPAKAEKPAAKEKPARVREPVTFEEGEKEKLEKRVIKALAGVDKKTGIVSKDLAAKLDIKTRKLRSVVYSMERAGTVKLKPGASRAAGMSVFPA